MKRARGIQFESEAEMAGAFQTHLEQLGWDCYPEVAVNRGGSRADIVAYRKPIVWVIEAKLSLGEAVCEQAKGWLGHAHFITVLVPWSRHRPVLEEWCRWKGIGIVRASRNNFRGEWHTTFDTVVEAKLHRSAWRNGRYIAEHLHPDMKKYVAGTNGQFSSPWRRTMDEAVRVIKENPGVSVKSIVATIKHHYHQDATARACLIKWLQQDKRVRAEKQGRAMCFWLADAPPTGKQQQLEAIT